MKAKRFSWQKDLYSCIETDTSQYDCDYEDVKRQTQLFRKYDGFVEYILLAFRQGDIWHAYQEATPWHKAAMVPTAYKLEVLVRVRFYDKQSNAFLWEEPALSGVQVYSASTLPGGMASLAKREEEIFVPGRRESIRLEKSDAALRLLMEIRDETHRFGIKYHRFLRDRELLEDK